MSWAKVFSRVIGDRQLLMTEIRSAGARVAANLLR